MKLEAVTVCINYSDFLRFTLPYNKKHFDNYVVVTVPDDQKTIDLCRKYGVKVITIEKTAPGELDNKGRAINAGLNYLDKDGWVLHLDADIWLPPLTRKLLNNHHLEKDCIYGVDRFMCESYGQWVAFIAAKKYAAAHKGWVFLSTDTFRIGKRMVQYNSTGFWPIGFFQLWHPQGSSVSDYPEGMSGYDRDDTRHLLRFKDGRRKFIPDFIAFHLSSEPHTHGQNWNGRATAQFGPDKCQYDFGELKHGHIGERRHQDGTGY